MTGSSIPVSAGGKRLCNGRAGRPGERREPKTRTEDENEDEDRVGGGGGRDGIFPSANRRTREKGKRGDNGGWWVEMWEDIGMDVVVRHDSRPRRVREPRELRLPRVHHGRRRRRRRRRSSSGSPVYGAVH